MNRSKKGTGRDQKRQPRYEAMIDFYKRIREAQDHAKTALTVEPVVLKQAWRDLLLKEGFPLLQREEFPLDLAVSTHLLQSLCRLAEETNPFLAEQTTKIRKILDAKQTDIETLLRAGLQEKRLEQLAGELGLDPDVLGFLIQTSIGPSIRTTAERLAPELDPEGWWKNYCPVCGSRPHLSLLKEESGKRVLLCSFCGYAWRVERVFCPSCANTDQNRLHFFCAEGEETTRIDMCEKCRRYIKTIDTRTRECDDPALEDLSTLHLDVLAIRKGYHRLVSSPWVTRRQSQG